MFIRDDYNRTVWVEVPDPLNPPPDAEAVSAENLNNLEDGVKANRDSIHSTVYPLVEDEFTEAQPFDEFHDATINCGAVTADNWSYSGVMDQFKSNGSAVQRLSSNEGIFQRVSLSASKDGWLSSTDYSVEDEAQPNMANGYYYAVQTAGTSGSSEPVWPAEGTVTDGSVVWAVGGQFWSDWG